MSTVEGHQEQIKSAWWALISLFLKGDGGHQLIWELIKWRVVVRSSNVTVKAEE